LRHLWRQAAAHATSKVQIVAAEAARRATCIVLGVVRSCSVSFERFPRVGWFDPFRRSGRPPSPQQGALAAASVSLYRFACAEFFDELRMCRPTFVQLYSCIVCSVESVQWPRIEYSRLRGRRHARPPGVASRRFGLRAIVGDPAPFFFARLGSRQTARTQTDSV